MEISSGEPSAKISKISKWVKETTDAHMLLCEIAKPEISNTGLDDVVFEKEKEDAWHKHKSTHETPHPQIWAFMEWVEALDLVRDKNSLLDQEYNDTGQIGESPIDSC